MYTKNGRISGILTPSDPGDIMNKATADTAIATINTTIAGKEPAIAAGTTSQYYRGDKSWQTLPTIPTRSFNNAPGRSIVTGTGATGFQPSSTRDIVVNYNCTIVTTASIGGNASGTIILEVAPTNSATAGDWVEVGRLTNGQAITLALALQSVQTIAGQVGAIVPAGYYAKLRSINNSGTPTYSVNSGQEVLL